MPETFPPMRQVVVALLSTLMTTPFAGYPTLHTYALPGTKLTG